jgi:tetratricopeptide (TPR) repeat protein
LLNNLSDIYADVDASNIKDSSRVCSEKAIEIARRINYKNGLAKALYDLGRYNIGVKPNLAEATHYILESLELFMSLKNSTEISKCYMQLGLISYILQNYDGAVKNLLLSLKNNDNAKSKYLLALSYTELDSFEDAKMYFYK